MKLVKITSLLLVLSFLIYLCSNQTFAQVSKKSNVVERGDLEGPDYIKPPKHYKTLSMILFEAGIVDEILGPQPVPVSGTREILVILVEFSDVSPDPTHTVEYFNDRFFNINPPSVRDYYEEISYGNFTYVPGTVLGWYTSTFPQNQWSNLDSRPVVTEAIQNADPDFDFAPYDTDGDGVVTNDELTIFIIVSGNQGGAFHWWTPTAVTTSDGVDVEAEFSGTHEERRIGSYCHELGHDLGLPDLYDTDPQQDGSSTNGLSFGIGYYGLMGWGSGTFSHMTAWSKIQLGWITPTIVTVSDNYDVHDAESNAEAYILIDTQHSNDEYFLVENRHPSNSYYETVGAPVAPDGTYPDAGIVIYHIDETRIQDWINHGINNVNVDEIHKGIDVETAEHLTSHSINADDLDDMTNKGDEDDLWDLSTYDFADNSSPCNANWYVDLGSGMRVGDFPTASQNMAVFFSFSEVEINPNRTYFDYDDQPPIFTIATGTNMWYFAEFAVDNSLFDPANNSLRNPSNFHSTYDEFGGFSQAVDGSDTYSLNQNAWDNLKDIYDEAYPIVGAVHYRVLSSPTGSLNDLVYSTPDGGEAPFVSLPSWHPDGTLVKGDFSPTVYLINNEVRHRIPNPQVFENQGFDWDNIINIKWRELLSYPSSTPVPDLTKYLFRTNLPGYNTTTVWVEFNSDGTRHAILSEEVFYSWGFTGLVFYVSPHY